MSYTAKNNKLIQLLMLVKYTATTLLIGATSFFVDVCILDDISRTQLRKSNRKVVVLISKVGVAYFINRNNWNILKNLEIQ